MDFADSKWAFLPDRYREGWKEPFHELVRPMLSQGCAVIDVGGGATPLLSPDERPEGCRYVGLDVSSHEMDIAPEGSYDEKVVAAVEDEIPGLSGSFDLALSWQVFEHVESLKASFEGLRNLLAPGGQFVLQMSGANAYFARLNQVIPEPVGKLAMEKLLGREPDTVFHANYDKGTKSRLLEISGDWSEFTVIPRYYGAPYLEFAKPLVRAYLVYENWLVRTQREDLATHYIVVGRR